MFYNYFKFAITAVVAVIASSTVSAQTTFTVTNLDDSGPESLRAAIESANETAAADTILFSVAGTIDLESQLPAIDQPVTIDGNGQITLDAGDGEDGVFATGDGFRIFNIDNAPSSIFIDVNLIGLTLTGGDSPFNSGIFLSPGGAIRNRETLTLTNVHILNNAAGGGGPDFPDGGDGGGIFNLAGFLTLIDSSVSGNRAGDGDVATGSGQEARGGEGGGILGTSPGTITLIRSTVSDNTSGMGGTNDGVQAAGGRGGGIFSSSNLVLDNSTISGNQTVGFDADGGGVSFLASASRSFIISNSTITDNLVSGVDSSGGGIYTNINTITIDNSIVAGNVASDSTSDIRLGTGSITANYSLFGQAVLAIESGDDNNVGVSPDLGPLADNGGLTQTHALLPNSPAVDAGDPTVSFDAGDFDQRGSGFARVVDGGVNGLRLDIGAFELSQSGVLLGDANLDGSVNFLDIASFIAVLAANGDLAQADVTEDGVVNFLDISPFIGLLANSGG